MKKLLIILFVLKTGFCAAQDTLTGFYDLSWKLSLPEKATYYSLAIKEDSLWKAYFFYMSNDKLQSQGYFVDNALKTATGPYRSYDTTGHLISQGYYQKGKKAGTWKYWYSEGKLSDSVFYLDGIVKFKRSYLKDGTITEMIDTDSSGKTFSRSFALDGKLKMEGELLNGKKQGQWKIYVSEEDLVQEVNFIRDSFVSVNCKTANGTPVKNCIYEKEAEMKGGNEAWQNYLRNALTSYLKKSKVGACDGKVVVVFIVDKEGYVSEARVLTSNNPELNEVALEIIKKSPRWNPAIQYNRKVKAYRQQPITFKCFE